MSLQPTDHAAPTETAPGKEWQAVRELLHGESPAGLRRLYPPPESKRTLLSGLGDPELAGSEVELQRGAELREAIQALLGQLEAFGRMSRCPILAITGLLNAGKSSLLATYLSPQNRERVLRGLSHDSGTHRFVLWLPQVWCDEPELLTTLITFLTDLFGHAPELLSADPELAALQYNGQVLPDALMQAPHTAPESLPQFQSGAEVSASVDSMGVPLIAYDDRLDALQLGLVDCPDIQSGFTNHPTTTVRGQELAATRQQQLRRIGRLCSAFVVVSRMNSLHDEGLLEILRTLRDAMPGVPRLLAVNRIKARYAPEVVVEQAQGLVDRFSIHGVYVAYDFRSALADTRIPSTPTIAHLRQAKLPIFFRADSAAVSLEAPSSSASGQVSADYLFDLSSQLDTSSLSRESNRSLRLQLKSKTAEAIQWLEHNQQLVQSHMHDAWETLAAACYEFMAERDTSGKATGLRLQASPSIVAQMADSLHRTAPFWMKASLSIDRTARQLHSAIANSAARFKILQSASDSVTQFAKRFKRGEGAQVVTKERFAKTLRTSDLHQVLLSVSDEELELRCEHAMRRFANEDQTQLNAAELDKWSSQVWGSMSLKEKLWKGTQPLAVLLAPLLAVVLVPIDAGGSAVLVFASAKELLAAAGIAAVMGPLATGGEALSIVHRETPWRQLSDLFAILCDCLGIQRPGVSELPEATCDRTKRRLSPSTMEVKLPQGPAAISLWQVQPQAVQELQVVLKQLGQA